MTSEAPHYRILVLDVENFSTRPDPVQRSLRAAMYDVVHSAFEAAGVPAGEIVWEDRGDGILMLVPPTVAPVRLAGPFVRALDDALREQAAFHSAAHALRIRPALRQGLAERDGLGWSGDAINTAFRLVDARPLRDVLRAAGSARLAAAAPRGAAPSRSALSTAMSSAVTRSFMPRARPDDHPGASGGPRGAHHHDRRAHTRTRPGPGARHDAGRRSRSRLAGRPVRAIDLRRPPDARTAPDRERSGAVGVFCSRSAIHVARNRSARSSVAIARAQSSRCSGVVPIMKSSGPRNGSRARVSGSMASQASACGDPSALVALPVAIVQPSPITGAARSTHGRSLRPRMPPHVHRRQIPARNHPD